MAHLGASFPSILHGGCLTPDKSKGEWPDLIINYLCAAGASTPPQSVKTKTSAL